MTQKVVTIYSDDLTGAESDEISTYTILVNGAGVEIDLTPESHDKLMEALRPFLQAEGARRVRSTGARGTTRRGKGSDGPDPAAVRAWAKSSGYEVNDRGRVPSAVHQAYLEAH